VANSKIRWEESMTLPRRQFLRLAAGAVSAPAVLRVAQAQDYPSRPIRLLVGYPPGGATDIIARICAQGLSERLGKPVVVENRGGTGGNLAGEAAARAVPDGYTLLHGADNMFTINPHVYAKMAYDPLKELMPIASLASNQLVLAVHPSVPVQNLREFVELAQRSKPPLLYASIGNGSMHHLAMEMLKQHVSIDLTHVPYRGGGPAAIALLAGEIAAMFGGGSIVPTVQSGKFRGLASTGTVRNPATPDLPTIAEIYPGYEALIWHGLFAPTGVPQPIVDRLRTEIANVMAQPAYGQRLFNTGSGEPYVGTVEAFVARIRNDYDKFGAIIRSIGIKVD
jgi:tripartite-type tricarboxylate transporter receptor subunit TctC